MLVSCSDDESSDYHYELLPIEVTAVPEVFEFGGVYDITVKYIRPDDCYINGEILYEYNQDARNIAVFSLVLEENGCETIDMETELTFQVQALQSSPYIFRFWQGDDDNGEPVYFTVEVPVIIPNSKNANEFEATHTEM